MTATRTAETGVTESAASSLALCATAAQKRTPMCVRRSVGTRDYNYWQCDDGNNRISDGCDDGCLLEMGFICN